MNEQLLSEFWRECGILSKLRPHVNIVQFLGVCLNPLCIVSEFLPNGEIKSWKKYFWNLFFLFTIQNLGDLWSYVSNQNNKISDELVLKWFKGKFGWSKQRKIHVAFDNFLFDLTKKGFQMECFILLLKELFTEIWQQEMFC